MTWDAIVIGSGFGGTMAAHALVLAGHRVMMIERGGWVARGPDNWGDCGAGVVTPHFSMESTYEVNTGRRRGQEGSWNCVGGQSVFYGGASYRFRASDFEHRPDIVGGSAAEWPFRYDVIEPFYSEAEQLLGVAGEPHPGADEPPHSQGYPQPVAPLSESAKAIAVAAARLGLTPSRIPLAISYASQGTRSGCMQCGNCDGYACAAEAKNDLASGLIPELMQRGLALKANTVCVRLLAEGSRVVGVECVNRVTGERERIVGTRVILAAGAIATPHLLLTSRLDVLNPAGAAVGRYLTRHRNAVVFGVFAKPPNPRRQFDKQIAVFDSYETAGCIQQLTPAEGLVRAHVPGPLRRAAAAVLAHSSGLLVIAEDQPRAGNQVAIDVVRHDRHGMPRVKVHHRYSERDERAAASLISQAKKILREAGAFFCFVHSIDTFSHALGTVRMGVDPASSPLDGDGRFRGVDNLYVVDGSALPRSAGVNPSLTIAANALRIGARIAASVPASERVNRSARAGKTLPVLIS